MLMSELAGMVNGSLSRLSNVVKRLEQRGLIRRLTPEGMALVETATPGQSKWP